MVERDYQHRDVLDKLSIKPGHAVAFACEASEIDPAATEDEAVDVVLAAVDASIS